MRKIGFVLALSLVFLWVPLRAEEIQLKDGNKITGKIIAVTDDAFQIKTAYGNIQVPRTDIIPSAFRRTSQSQKVTTSHCPKRPQLMKRFKGRLTPIEQPSFN